MFSFAEIDDDDDDLIVDLSNVSICPDDQRWLINESSLSRITQPLLHYTSFSILQVRWSYRFHCILSNAEAPYHVIISYYDINYMCRCFKIHSIYSYVDDMWYCVRSTSASLATLMVKLNQDRPVDAGCIHNSKLINPCKRGWRNCIIFTQIHILANVD